jgi:hypothetical protein
MLAVLTLAAALCGGSILATTPHDSDGGPDSHRATYVLADRGVPDASVVRVAGLTRQEAGARSRVLAVVAFAIGLAFFSLTRARARWREGFALRASGVGSLHRRRGPPTLVLA